MRARDYQPGDDVPGTVYKVLRLIGAGGMGTVYDVEDTTIGKRYVLKTLHPRLGAREDLARRIQNEARTLARLHHPNIVEVITAGVTADSLKLPYYLMERLSGQSLRLVLEKRGQLDLLHAYHIGIDLLDALDHAHDKGVIHRDVKPDNIFLHRTLAGVTVTKLLDFGIVSMLDASSAETAGRFLGTLRYAAPEQLRGEKPTAKTDIYSAALVLYEILGGRGPFDDEGDAHRIAAAHLNKFPPAVSQFVPVPRELEVLIMAALAKNPDARPRDAFSFAASLRNLKRGAEDVQLREHTENRVTASMVIGPESSPLLTDGGAQSPDIGAALSSGGAPFVKTTWIGMPTPTLAPPTPNTGPLPFDTMRDARHAVATTHTIAHETAPVPQNGTEALGAHWPPLLGAARVDGSTEIQWPIERAPILSDEPQVKSLPAASLRALGLRPIALAGCVALAVTAMAALAMHVRSAPHPPSTAAIVAKAPVTALPPAPVVTPPMEEQAVGSTTAPVLELTARPASSEKSLSQDAPLPPQTALRAKTAAPNPKPLVPRPPPHPLYATDRPGPGF